MEIKPDSSKNLQNGGRPISQGTRIGHVHLKVANIERALGFYCGVLGFEVTQRFGDSAAFLSAGGYHHHLAVNTWESLGGSPPPPGYSPPGDGDRKSTRLNSSHTVISYAV